MDPRIIKLACPHCGAALEIQPDQPEQFACGYCGAAVLVQRRGGTVALREIAAGIERVRESSDKTAAELAIRRYREELDTVIAKRDALQKSTSASQTGCALGGGCCGLLIVAIAIGAGASALGVVFILAIPSILLVLALDRMAKSAAQQLEPLNRTAQELQSRLAEKKQIADG